MPLISEPAAAKINLTLRVAGRRGDGFHELQSLVAFARDVADVVTLDTGRSPGVSSSGPFAASIAGENLVARTLEKIEAAEPELNLGHVDLEKNLPVAAGIGGGSADAAAVLRALLRANPQAVDRVDWMAIAASLGADVPVCFRGQPTWMTGIGESLAAVQNLPSLSLVLVNPLRPMPPDKTALVFRRLGAPPLAADYAAPAAPAFENTDALLGFIARNGNDLTASAASVAPDIAEVMEALNAVPGCRHAGLSGGGPTCFGIFDDAARATGAVQTIRDAHPAWWVRASSLA